MLKEGELISVILTRDALEELSNASKSVSV